MLSFRSIADWAKEQVESLCKVRPHNCPILRGRFEDIREFFSVTQDLELKRELTELMRTLRSLYFETDANTELLQGLNFSLKNSQGMFHLAAIAKIYNENRDQSSAEAETLKNFIDGLKQSSSRSFPALKR